LAGNSPTSRAVSPPAAQGAVRGSSATILVEPLLLALRRLAQVDASARRFGAD